jgi:phage repressor protein C with HTH and peptisase S24 domain
MKTIGERAAFAREKRGLERADISARVPGLSYQALQQLETNKSAGTKHMVALARALAVRPEWLESGAGEMDLPNQPPLVEAPTTDLNISQMPRDLPVLGSASCGEDGLFEFNGETLDRVRRPPRLIGVQKAYALYTFNDCMSPWRENGDLVYVHPQMPVKINDYVVVQLKQENDGGPIPAYVKRLVRRTEENLKLLQYNPRKEILIPMRKVATIHRIMDWSELMGL